MEGRAGSVWDRDLGFPNWLDVVGEWGERSNALCLGPSGSGSWVSRKGGGTYWGLGTEDISMNKTYQAPVPTDANTF